MTKRVLKPLRLINRRIEYEDYLIEDNRLPVQILRVYKDPLHRLLISQTTKGMIGAVAETEIEQSNQGIVLRHCSIPESLWSIYCGKVLLVRMVNPIPIDFMFDGSEGEVVFTRNREVVSSSEVLLRLPVDNPAEFLDEIIVRSEAIFSKAKRIFFEKKMIIENLQLNFGIESHGEDPIVPLWVGGGITPKTALIFDGDERVMDCNYYSTRVIHPRVLEREMAGIRANASPSFLIKVLFLSFCFNKNNYKNLDSERDE